MSQFALTERQKTVRAEAAALAKTFLEGAYESYSKYADQLARFRATRPFYAKAVKAGFVKKMLPKAIGGASESWLDVAICLEEYYRVDASLTIHAVGVALGLLPLIIGGTPEQQKKWCAPFISGEGDHLASLTHSEPGGTANFLEKGGKGLGVTAKKVGDFYIVNGEKLWTTNSAGWDGRGATLSLLCVRYSETGGPEDPNVDPADNVMILAVTREVIASNPPEAYQLLGEPDLLGHVGVTGPHTRYTNLKVPAENLIFDRGQATPIIEKAFGVTAPLVGAFAIGTMRAAFERALAFARNDNRGGTVPIIQRQSVADLLMNAKIKIDTSRLLVWKALDVLEHGPGDRNARFEYSVAAKIYATDCAVPQVFECMQAVGMTSYAEKTAFPKLLSDAAVFALFDGGNVGIRRRQYQRLLCGPDYQPWASL
ncbi:hypothetical protein PV08_08234 [Exophiala spinifera]|uniref:Acyl-CoA dehydrogenase n=1 Tax=Exophiala spinifera TaxID=91928 RepID=A0A0D1ZJS1_9EURO|nr:uncharacterized protein PV08_08234 [Exophiala spinifera]KIW13047.1 hypothetical protein PV08_08234 [Exophiala spinifera]